MNSRIRNALYTLALLVALWALWKYRQGNTGVLIKLEGKTMGTSYHITYFDGRGRNFQTAVDSLLVLINKSINTYDTTSEISRFNRANRSIKFELPYFFTTSSKVTRSCDGLSGCV